MKLYNPFTTETPLYLLALAVALAILLALLVLVPLLIFFPIATFSVVVLGLVVRVAYYVFRGR